MLTMNNTPCSRHKYWEVVGPVTSRRNSEAKKAFSDGRDRHVFGGGAHGSIAESNAKRIFGIETCHSIRAIRKYRVRCPQTRALVVNLPTLTEKERYSFLRRVLEKKPDVYAFFGDVVNLKDIVIRTRANKFNTIRNIVIQSASEEGVPEEGIIIKEKGPGDIPKPKTSPNYFETGSFYPQKEDENTTRALKGIPVYGLCEMIDDGRVLFRLADGAMRRHGRRIVNLLVKRGVLRHKCEMVVMNNSQVKSYLSKPGRVIRGVDANRLVLRRPNFRKDFSKISKKVASRWMVVAPEYTIGRRFDHMIRNGLVRTGEGMLSDVYTVDLPFHGKDTIKVKEYLGITNAKSIGPFESPKQSARRKMLMVCFDFDTPMGDKVNYITRILRLDPRILVNFTDPIGVNGVTFTLPKSVKETETLIEEMKTSLATCVSKGHEKPEVVVCNNTLEKETLDSRNHNRKCAIVAFYLENIDLTSRAVPSSAYCFAATSSKRVFFRVPKGVNFKQTRLDLLSTGVVGFEGLVYNISVKECNAIVRKEGVLIQENLDLLLSKRRPKLERCTK